MNVRLLVNGIFRQTTILVAQLSTASGARSPLTRVADQVFLNLARELEAQGIARAVAADMFGLALRSYQKKIQRLGESASERGSTLWQAIYDFIDKNSPTRSRISERFTRDNEREVGAVLHDLVSSGMVFVTGSGQRAVYGSTTEALRSTLVKMEDSEALAHLIWLHVFRGEARTVDELVRVLGVERVQVESALELLSESGRVSETDGKLAAQNLVIPLENESGAETAMLDHFRAVCKVLAQKTMRLGTAVGGEDREGGSTFSFAVHEGHPFEAEVSSLLQRSRRETQALWAKVAAYNEVHGVPANATRLTYYLGQVTDTTDDEEEA